PLFKTPADLDEFHRRHDQAKAKTKPLDQHHGAAFLGIDAGSTTTKITLIDENGALLYSYYGNNDGEPLEKTMAILKKMYQMMPPDVFVGKACVTGYGEHLIKAALKVDLGEVETMAHYKAADFFQPGVDFILDIGG